MILLSGLTIWSASILADATSVPVSDAAPVAASVPVAPVLLEASRIRGLWVWRREFITDDAKRAAMLAFCSEHHFNRLLVQMRTVPGSSPTDPLVFGDQDQWRALLKEASATNIFIEALDGAHDMATAPKWKSTLAQLDALLAFNRSLPADQSIAGIHYDIEPYLLPQWKTEARQQIMEQYLQFLLAANARLRLDGKVMTLAVDIPFWYDRKTEPGDSCVLNFMGETKNFHQHIQDLTDYIGIMAYRQKSLGPNSMAYHCEAELEYAKQIGHGIGAAAEVNPLKDAPNITFHGLPAATFWEQIQLLQTNYATEPAFAGVLIHSYDFLPRYLAGE